jgi:hypothetical protein
MSSHHAHLPTLTWPTRIQLVVGATSLCVLAAVVKEILRPWMFLNGPAWVTPALGVAPSLLAGLSLPLWFLAIPPHPHAHDVQRSCVFAAVTMFAAELIERRLPGSTFDWMDLAAALLGVAAIALIGMRFKQPAPEAEVEVA